MADAALMALLKERIEREGAGWLSSLLVSPPDQPSDVAGRPTGRQARPARCCRPPSRLSPSPALPRQRGRAPARNPQALPSTAPAAEGAISRGRSALAAEQRSGQQGIARASTPAASPHIIATPLALVATTESVHRPQGHLARWFGCKAAPPPPALQLLTVNAATLPPSVGSAELQAQQGRIYSDVVPQEELGSQAFHSSDEVFDCVPGTPTDGAQVPIAGQRHRACVSCQRDGPRGGRSISPSVAGSSRCLDNRRRRRSRSPGRSCSGERQSGYRRHSRSKHSRRHSRSSRRGWSGRHSSSSSVNSRDSRFTRCSHRSRRHGRSRRSHDRGQERHPSAPAAAVTVVPPLPTVSTPDALPSTHMTVASFQGPAPAGGTGGLPMPLFPLGSADEHLIPLVQSSVAPATWSGHGKAWREWLACAEDDVLHSPQNCHGITVTYLSWLRDKGVSARVAQKRLSGVAFAFKLLGLLDATKSPVFSLILRGWKKEKPTVDMRRPVSFSLLQRIVGSTAETCVSAYECLLFQCAFMLSFFGALRISELVSPSRMRVAGLLREDVVLLPDSIRLRVSRSKTDLYGQGAWLSIFSLPSSLCPVDVITRSVAVRPSGPCFLVHADSTPLTKFQFTRVFKRCLGVAGVNPSEYGTHSFCIGAATVAEAGGMSDAEVKRLGRWKSDALRRYVRPHLLI
ncbi:uncharacterized protein LOC142728910 [Rhinoderma darwinii]|uniref:uncharacterized protein LOC142728909 n=1 Tax=Rhinoderma darwinii TaxID=43563 RepID=UPI003F67E9A4